MAGKHQKLLIQMGHKSEETTKVYYVITNDRDSDASLL